MGFLAPVFAFFAVLAAVPILIHLFGRPRARRLPFAALRFLLQSDRKTAAQRRLREVLLLVARALAIAAVPLAIAKPYLETLSDLPGGAAGNEAVVIVLDDSRSMGRSEGDATLFAIAQERALRLAQGLGRDSEAAVLLTSDGAAPPQGDLVADRSRLERAITQARLTRRPGDTSAALRRAAALLAASPRPARRVCLVSDVAAHGFGAEPPWGEGGPSLQVIDVGGGAPPANHAVLDLRVRSAPHLGPRGIEVEAALGNFSAEPVRDLPLTLRVDGRPVAKGLVELGPGERGVKRFFHALSGEELDPDEARPAGEPVPPRVHALEVELPEDALPDDDRRYARVEERRELRALVVDGDPRTVRREDEVFYLETALRPGDRAESRLAVEVTTLDDLPRHPLGALDVVFLANAKAPDPERAGLLRAFVEQGGGLFLSVGSRVDPDAWNAAVGDLLPQPLAVARTVGRTLDARDDGESRVIGEGERLARFDRRHPVLAPFEGGDAGGPAEALREARVGRFVLLKPTPKGPGEPERRALLHLESGAPLLVEGRVGAGRVMLLATTIDRDWSDLAIQPAFLPLVQQAARYLARAPLGEPEAPTLAGQPHEIPLHDGDSRVEVTLPSGAVRWFGEDQVLGRPALRFADTAEPGVHRVAIAGRGTALRPRPAATFVVNVDPVESDPARIDPDRLAALAKPSGSSGAGGSKRQLPLWHALGAALLGLLLIEGVLTVRR